MFRQFQTAHGDRMVKTLALKTTAICLFLAANSASGQTTMAPVAPSYADIVDLAVDTPLAMRATIRKVIKLPKPIAAEAGVGRQRVLIQAVVTALIRGEQGIGREVSYLYDTAVDARGKLPKLAKREVLLLARPTSTAGQIQLIARDGQIDWTPTTESMLRSVVAEVLGSSPPPRITGIGQAFHVAGTIAGESETQIFLKTASGDPVSLSIIRRPGQAPSWAAALGEIVDESAAKPTRPSLLWYSMACYLPQTLPEASLTALNPVASRAALDDYRVVLDGLGPCGRTRERA